MNIAILGAGTYGSYTVYSILEKYPDAEITVFDVGDRKIKSEAEIGFGSRLKRFMYKGLTNGRYFGWGGTSDKWGGQLLTYTENDFKHPDNFMKDVIHYDKAMKDEVLAKFNIKNPYPENRICPEMFTKTGVWLSMLHRNFFYWFKINTRRQVKVLSHCRVVRFNSADGKKIDSVVYRENGVEKITAFDFYFLTSGAFESARILLSSNLIKENKVYFSDHLSQKVFKINGSTKIGDEDFVFRMSGTSLITKRMVGEINNNSFYVHPVFNLKFPFFETVKNICFYKKLSFKLWPGYILTAIKDIPNVIGFVWSVLVLRKMFVLNNEWFLYIDIENPSKMSYIELSAEKDMFGVDGVNVYYTVDDDAKVIFDKAKEIAVKHLSDCHINYEVLQEDINIQTCEDIYHPYGMFNFRDVEDYFTRWSNMLVVTTGVLSRSGGINPTASVLPLVDVFVNERLK